MTDGLDRPVVEELDEQELRRAGGEDRASQSQLDDGARWILAALSAGAALIHFAMAPSHTNQSLVEGVGFIVAGFVQLGLAAGLLARPARWMLQLTVLANAVFVAVWVVSRTAGLPFGAHPGHPETAGFVDLTCVAFEIALVLGAAAALVAPRGARLKGSVGAGIAVFAVLGLTGAAIASPGAADHASHSHGDHAAADGHADDAAHSHGEHATDGDDNGWSLLHNGHQHDGGVEDLDPATQAALASQLAPTAELVALYPNIAAAEAAGYRRAGPFAPGLGIHYMPPTYNLNADGVIDPSDILAPMLIFDGTEPDAPLAGFMYLAYGSEGEPEGFVGPNDHWHYHESVCIVMGPNGIDTPFGADLEGVTSEMCDGVGGRFIDNTGYMVHVWTVPGYESPDGTFTELNPRITCPDGTYYMIDIEDLGDRNTTCRDAFA
jgi:hypothetical protein